MQPAWAHSDLKPLDDWFARHSAAPSGQSSHAVMVEELRAKTVDQLQRIDINSLSKLEHWSFFQRAHAELLELQEKKSLVHTWRRPFRIVSFETVQYRLGNKPKLNKS